MWDLIVLISVIAFLFTFCRKGNDEISFFLFLRYMFMLPFFSPFVQRAITLMTYHIFSLMRKPVQNRVCPLILEKHFIFNALCPIDLWAEASKKVELHSV